MSVFTVPEPHRLRAPADWHVVDFISDLHLQAAEPLTHAAFDRYVRQTPADALFILGDLFEVWVGDDSARAPGLERDCAAALRSAAQRMDVYLMHGNRDFLIGTEFAREAGVRLLPDPCVLEFGAQDYWLTHGDALCLADTEYLAFREQVRSPGWQGDFLAKPLAARREIAAAMRERSEQVKRSRTDPADWADVDTDAAVQCLRAVGARTMIHGHTHKPARHQMTAELTREVLSDWCLDAGPERAQALRLDATGLHRVEVR